MVGDGGEEIIIATVIYPHGTVSVSSLGYFSSVGPSSKPSRPYLTISLGSLQMKDYCKNKKGRKRKLIKPQQEKARQEDQMKRRKVIV